jgi:glycosyltransferase involved in cell wall biosynthesis
VTGVVGGGQRATRGAVHQFVPSFAGRDAIGRHTVQARSILRGMGFASEIYAGEVVRGAESTAKRSDAYRPEAGVPTWNLYQCSTGSTLGDWLMERPEPLALDYHNITPAELFEVWEPTVGVELRHGRRQLADLARHAVIGLADSAYNAEELDRLGCARTHVAPILLDLADFDGEADRRALARLQATKTGADWLFVGRVAPNKAQHDVIAAFCAYRRHVDPGARLRLVGGSSSHRYATALHAYVERLGLADAVEFASSVSHEELIAHYRTADVFVCLSDHEGFCVPLLEAMHAGVPVVAYAAAAVPETLGAGGVLLDVKDPVTVATAVHRVLRDAGVRDAVVAAGRRRLADFSLERTAVAFVAGIEAMVEAAPGGRRR